MGNKHKRLEEQDTFKVVLEDIESDDLIGDDDEFDDGIQYVSVMPAKRKSRIVEEVTLQTSAPAKRGRKAKKEREEVPFENMGRDPRDNRPRYEDVDFEERAKQEHLDSLYDDDYDDDDFGGKGKLAIILGIVGLILIIFLIFRTVSLGSKLEDAQNQLTQSQDYKEKYEEIQLEKRLADMAQESPVGRNGTATDVAKAMEYLANAEFITGHVLSVNGGYVI